MQRHRLLLPLGLVGVIACGPDSAPGDAGGGDAGSVADAGDSGGADAVAAEAGAEDAGLDAALNDGSMDPDASVQDAGQVDAADAQTSDAAQVDAADAETSDAAQDATQADAADAQPGCAADGGAIAQAIAAASAGATVRVCAGDHVVSLYIAKDLELVGEGSDTTRLTSPVDQPIVSLDEGASVVLQGLTLHDSSAGAVQASAAGPTTLRDCVLEDNAASYGAGVYGPMTALLTLDNVELRRNQAGLSGGAVYGYRVLATNVRVVSNSASVQAGGMLLVGDGAEITATDTLFETNQAGALWTPDASLTDTVFRDNASGSRATLTLGSGTLTRVTFEGNTTTQTGAALAMQAAAEGQAPSVTLTDSTVTGNTSGYGGAVYLSGNSTNGDSLGSFVSDGTDWGSSDDNAPHDVMVHDITVGNSAYSYTGTASFTCTFSPRQCM